MKGHLNSKAFKRRLEGNLHHSLDTLQGSCESSVARAAECVQSVIVCSAGSELRRVARLIRGQGAVNELQVNR